MNKTDDIKRRILALCPADKMPMLDFELRMLMATQETDSLLFINEHWRPIAEERDQLRLHLDAALAKPTRERAPKADPDADVRFTALTIDYENLKKQHANLQEAHKKLQADCDDLLNDQRPARERA